MRNKILFTFISILIVLSLLKIISAEVNISSPEYLDLLNKFESGESKIQVIIEIDSKNSINDITSSISETEVKFIREMMFGEGFVAEITEVGLNTLANSTHVNKISFDRVAQITDNKTGSEQIEINGGKQKKINIILGLIGLIIFFIIAYIIFKKRR